MSWRDCPDPTLGDRPSVEAVETVIVARAADLGGFEVRRALPAMARQMVGPFIFIDQMGPTTFAGGSGIDVRPHPHIGLATVTYLLDGEIVHRDSLGTELAIRPGAVNWMQAGSGIVHSERTGDAARADGQRLFGMQTWAALPKDLEENAPSFTHIPAKDLPTADDGPLKLRLIAGETHGLVSPLKTASATFNADLALAAGGKFEIESRYEERAIYTLTGRIEIDGAAHDPGSLLILRPGAPVVISALDDARLMLFGGAPMEGPRYIWWNFVSSSAERIAQAKEEWAKGQFDTVPGDEDAFIALPDNGGKPRRAVGGKEFDF